MAKRPALHITPADLDAAWQRRRRADWPAGFDAVMADPMLSRLVRSEAVRAAVAQATRAAAPRPAPRAAPPHAPARPTAAPRTTAPLLDRKRLAAGDSLDD